MAVLVTTFQHYLEITLDKATHGIVLADHVKAKRADGWTWQQIADNLHDLTGVSVSRESLRQWFHEDPAGDE